MLAISRQEGQSVTCITPAGEYIEVVVLKGSRVRLGFSAPRDVQIIRDDCKDRPPLSETECERAGEFIGARL